MTHLILFISSFLITTMVIDFVDYCCYMKRKRRGETGFINIDRVR